MIIFFNKVEADSAGQKRLFGSIGIETVYFAQYHPAFYHNTTMEQMRNETSEGVNYVRKLFDENEYDMIILDEIIISVRDDYIEESVIIELMKDKPSNLELILTGRGVTDNISSAADLVSKIMNIKHPYDKGVKWKKGIEV